MIETITLDTRKVCSPVGKPRISPLRRGERNNVTLTVTVRRDRNPYDLAGMTAHLVWQAADGKLVGPVPMEVTDPDASTVRCTLPDACYAAVGKASAYIELRRGAELVDTTDEMIINVLDCIDADGEQAEEYKPLIAEVREATDAAKSAATRAESGEDERVAIESARVSAEESRDQAEQARKQAESTRASSEALRALSETSRSDAESLRKQAESLRVDAETKREDAFAKSVEKANAATESAAKVVSDAQIAIAEVKATEAKLYPAAENTLKGTVKDTFIHVDDAFPSILLGIDIEGAAEQFTSTGKNLARLTEDKKTSNGVNIDIKANGQIILDGTCQSTNGLWVRIGTVDVVEGKTYCLSLNRAYSTFGVSAYSESENRHVIFAYGGKQAAKGTATKTETLLIFAVGGQNETFTKEVVSIQVEEGDTWSHWEPYTDGKPSPSPEYPQEIKVIENPTLKVAGADTSSVSTSTPLTLPAEHPYLAKLPDGTADEIVVDKDGNVSLVARVQNADVSNLPAPSKITPLDNGMTRYSYFGVIDTPAKTDTSAFAPAFASVIHYMFPKQGMYASKNSILVGASADPTEALKDGGYIYTTLATPVTYQLGKIEMPKVQDSIVNVWTDAEVTPRTGIEYTRDVNIVVANLESAIASITQG